MAHNSLLGRGEDLWFGKILSVSDFEFTDFTGYSHDPDTGPGGYIKTQKRKTKKILSDKIVRFREDFLRFPGKFPVFGVVTLLPEQLNF